jgi:hypothetical protein
MWAPLLSLLIWFLIIISQEPGKFVWHRDGFIVIIHIILLIAVLISWWYELIGGILLLVGFLALIPYGILMLLKGGCFTLLPLLLFYSPFLICGILYVCYWHKLRESIRESKRGNTQ